MTTNGRTKEDKPLLSELLAKGMEKYPPSPVPTFVHGTTHFMHLPKLNPDRPDLAWYSTPIGAIAAGLGLDHTWHPSDVSDEVERYCDEWDVLYYVDMFTERDLWRQLLQFNNWDGKQYRHVNLLVWLRTLERMAGYEKPVVRIDPE